MSINTKKHRQIAPGDHSETSTRGLPSLSLIRLHEKLTTSVSCKIYPSLAKWVHEHGGSKFLRGLIMKAKENEEATE